MLVRSSSDESSRSSRQVVSASVSAPTMARICKAEVSSQDILMLLDAFTVSDSVAKRVMRAKVTEDGLFVMVDSGYSLLKTD